MNEQGRAKIVEATRFHFDIDPPSLAEGEHAEIVGVRTSPPGLGNGGYYIMSELRKAGFLVMDHDSFVAEPDTPQLKYLFGPDADGTIMFFDLNVPRSADA